MRKEEKGGSKRFVRDRVASDSGCISGQDGSMMKRIRDSNVE